MQTTVLTALIVIALIGIGEAQVSQSGPARHLTHKQAIQLVNTACTAEEHAALAQYFRQEAQRKRDKQQYYMEVAATYGLHAPRVDMYKNGSTQDYYKRSADEARDAALADDRMATLEDKFAEGLARPK